MTGELPPDVVIDASNVCCDRRFDDTGDLARWDRLETVIDAYRQQVRRDARVLAYADASLARKLDRSDRRHLKEAQRDGWLVVCDVDADARVLQTARDAGAHVVSGDRFVDYRREHDWIDNNETDFFDWVRDGDRVVIRQREMGTHTGFSVSRAVERTMLKERGLLQRHDGEERVRDTLMRTRFRCINPACLAARLTPNDVGIPQRLPDGSVVCPSCREPVEDAGPRPEGIQLKLQAGETTERAVLAEGQALVLGRGQTSPDGLDPSLLLDDESRRWVSREHVDVRLDDGQLRATDLDSTQGTTIQRWRPSSRDYAPPQKLVPGEPIELRRRDRLVLAELVTIARSGQEYGAR